MRGICKVIIWLGQALINPSARAATAVTASSDLKKNWDRNLPLLIIARHSHAPHESTKRTTTIPRGLIVVLLFLG
jgi:hypothetical protein